jgi:hypothetical protein
MSQLLMSQLISKPRPGDNSAFGRDMKRDKKEENVSNLIIWLQEEARFPSRGRNKPENENATRISACSKRRNAGTPECRNT